MTVKDFIKIEIPGYTDCKGCYFNNRKHHCAYKDKEGDYHHVSLVHELEKIHGDCSGTHIYKKRKI